MKTMSEFRLDNKDGVGFSRIYTDHLGMLAAPLDAGERSTLTSWLGDYFALSQLEFAPETSPDMLWSLSEMFRVAVSILFCFRVEAAAYKLMGRDDRQSTGYQDPLLIEAVSRVLEDPVYRPFVRTTAAALHCRPEDLAELIGSGEHEDNGKYYVAYQGEIRNANHDMQRGEDGMWRLGSPPRPFPRPAARRRAARK